MRLPVPEVKFLLSQSFSRETSVTPDLWTQENPSYGHCAAAVLVAQDYLEFGTVIRRGLLPKEWAERLGYRSHYWLWLPGPEMGMSEELDCTREQFPPDFPYDDFRNGKIGDVSDREDKREYLLSNEQTKSRYMMLKERFEKALHSNALFLDDKFQRCWALAFSEWEHAKCPKMRFGCLVYDGDELITQSPNRLMTTQFGKERFCSLDGSSCIRMGIQSRMDATVGDCGHAPIWCLADVWRQGYKPEDLKRLNFYEAGFSPQGAPWWRKEPCYSCTDCQNRFAIFGLDKINIAHDGTWVPAWTRDSFYSSGEYATGQKKV